MNAAKGVGMLLLVCLTSCASPPSPATEAEKTTAATDYINCLGTAAQKMDDGTSDAGTIALAIEPMCAEQFERSVEANGRGMNPVAFSMYHEKAERNQIQMATAMVLKVRALKAQEKSKQ